jgi:hypothetical protein
MLTACKSCRLSFLLAGFSLAQKSWGFGTEELSVDFLVHFHLYASSAGRRCVSVAASPWLAPAVQGATAVRHSAPGRSAL